MASAVEQYQHPEDAVRVGVQNCAEALACCQGRLTREDAQAFPSLILEEPWLIDEFSVEPLAVSLRHLGEPPFEATARWQESLEARGHDYEAQLVGIAGLRAAVEGAGWSLSGLQKTTSHQFEGRWDGEATRSAFLFFHLGEGLDPISIDVYLEETGRGLTGNIALVIDLLPLGGVGPAGEWRPAPGRRA